MCYDDEVHIGLPSPSLKSMNNLTLLYEIAESLYQECLELTETLLGTNYPNTLMVMDSLADTYLNQRKFELAEKLCKECLRPAFV